MFNHRPAGEDPYFANEEPDAEFWADNWFSNSLAYLSKKFLPEWCATEDHWTIKFMDVFYASCICCLFFRGIIVGAALGSTLTALALYALLLL